MQEIRQDPVGIAKQTVQGFQESDGTGMAAESAYRIVFALPATLIFFASLSSLFSRYTGVDVFTALLDWADESLPSELYETLEIVVETAEQQGGFGVLSIGIVIALWSASNAMGVIVKAINRAHDLEETRGFVRQKALALGLTIGLSLFIITSFVLFVFGQQIGDLIAGAFGLGDAFTTTWNILRWPVLVALVVVGLGVLYWLGPAVRPVPRFQTAGALFATVLWLLATFGFTLYLEFSDPGSAYGVLGGLLVLLMFLYLTSIIIILGAELNAAIVQRRRGHVGAMDRETHPIAMFDVAIDNRHERNTPRLVAWGVVAALFVVGLLGGKRSSDERPDAGKPPID